MDIESVEFIGSFPNLKKTPVFKYPEYAFVGRSNVGKSSLINMLVDRKSLALVSSKPGKTRMLNFFLVNKNWYLVDLPGYGYAKVAKKMRLSWTKIYSDFLLERQNLECIFILIDANIPPQKIDIDFINWLGSNQIPFVILYTKTDKSSGIKISENIAAFQKELMVYWEKLPTEIKTSAIKNIGREDILLLIEGVNNSLQN